MAANVVLSFILSAPTTPMSPRTCAYEGASTTPRAPCSCAAEPTLGLPSCFGTSFNSTEECATTANPMLTPPCCVCTGAVMAFAADANVLLPAANALLPPVAVDAVPHPAPVVFAGEPTVENPAAMLDCLRRHRWTPLACKKAIHAGGGEASPPPPRPVDCDDAPGGRKTVCGSARGGRCAYDAVRGWYCACTGGVEGPGCIVGAVS